MGIADFRKVRQKFISPKKVLCELGLKEGERVIDYASGAGHWTIAAASIVGKTGSVLALESDIGMLGLLMGMAEAQKLSNIDIEEIDLLHGVSKKAGKADLVIVANTLHLVSDRDAFAKKIASMVAEDGKLLVVDWNPKETLLGPPINTRLTEENVIGCFEKVGLKLACTVDAGWQHFGLVFDHVGDGCGWKE